MTSRVRTAQKSRAITLYVTSYDLYGKDADGTACERVYLTDRKLNGYAPHVGDTVDITYTRQGKPAAIQLLEAAN